MKKNKITEGINNIVSQLANHEKRLMKLEGSTKAPRLKSYSGKQRTLREVVKGRKFKNGQEQIAVIVGYYEKVVGSLINKDKIKEEWSAAKITNKFSSEFISRAKNVLVRIQPDETCDLTQGGEDFFDKFIKNEPLNQASK